MRSIARTFAAASLVLLGTAAAQAAELNLPPGGVQGLPVVQIVEPTFAGFLGDLTVRVGNEKGTGDPGVFLHYDLEAKTFSMLLSRRILFTGNLAPKGKSGRKFTMFLDPDSRDTLRRHVAKAGALLANRSSEEILGDSSKLVLKLDEEGVPSVKIQSRVLTSALGEVVFKATATQSDDAPPLVEQ